MHAQHIYRVLGIEKYTLLKMEVTNKMEQQPINGNNQQNGTATNKWSKTKKH